MNIKYICTYWGCENQSAKEFLSNVVDNDYDGVEINFPNDDNFIAEFIDELENIRNTTNNEFIFVAQQVLPNKNETVNEYAKRISERLEFLTSLKPNYINSHTGKDYYEFSDNCKIIELTEQISRSSEIPIWHEIHRGRFSFHLKTLLKYLDIYPKLKLIADFSHFCVVSESYLQDQEDLLTKIYPNIKHIHARIGFEQSPQVNNPFAPEWNSYLTQYSNWWEEIISIQKKRKLDTITITPEFGPFPYMPQEPFTKKPHSNQWEINLQMKHYLQQNLKTNG
ncbi:sugar phosphate isomerase/epimerase [Flavobacterium macrobrachii]|uniref:Sugar phosphate isomerase/epimerase n=1 Tax=Flavobacterium macrobrachii TaxID=591204 RepID=A0ABS2CU40_9FLAO|nr:sugar phosphate isomerase/epimerase [Flavobacterium macrobrachii]MBM6498463.1 sugar phosphate isomerase/epimerase [Flavobacterium macrobrachii]PZO27563.1 MAG: xylose isomerase [Flavobacteriaceae bacterium]